MKLRRERYEQCTRGGLDSLHRRRVQVAIVTKIKIPRSAQPRLGGCDRQSCARHPPSATPAVKYHYEQLQGYVSPFRRLLSH